MAKTITIDQAIDGIMNNYEKSIREAVKYASDKAVDDIYKYSMSCLEEYYNNYNPTSYERTDYLWHAILPYAEQIKETKDTIISTVGIAYDASALEGVYHGSKQYDPTDASWVLDNYLRGVHPATNGSRNPDTVEYFEIIDGQSPYVKMQEYLSNTVPGMYLGRLWQYFIRSIK